VQVETVRVDGGMSANRIFVQALADAAQRPIEVSPVREATALGAAFAAGRAIGMWSSDEELAATWRPAERVEPQRSSDRARWHEAVARAQRWIPELSVLEF
jgi:glycerol kinase